MLGLVSYHRGTHYSCNYVLSSFHSTEGKIWPPLTKRYLTCLYADTIKRDVVWTTYHNWILCLQWGIPHASVNAHEVPKTWDVATRNYLGSGNKSDRRMDIYALWTFLVKFDATKKGKNSRILQIILIQNLWRWCYGTNFIGQKNTV